jgi:hypothetical protein
MLYQGDAMKKGITFKLTVMTTVLLVIAIVVTSIISNTKKM